jgi:CHAT domain-containing protein
VKDFFDLRMDVPLFILMACNSATQQVSIGDEPLGLITAILTAGASSIVGTLWGVASETARIFAERFTQKLIDAGGSSMTDLAVALQQTVLSLKSDYNTRLPYHWAPFVLHGSYFSRSIRIASEV